MNRFSKFLGVSALAIGIGAFAYMGNAVSMEKGNADSMDGHDSAMEMGHINQASFTMDNKAKRPEGWRYWVFIGSPLTPNALNGGEAAFPEFHNVYIEPSAFKAYIETGEFPEGTQIVKELMLVQKSDDMDENGSILAASGRGFFQGEFNGLELLVKDHKRFPNEPGGWAFFSFAHNSPDYGDIASALPFEMCSSCHQANGGQDYIFTQYYPILTAGDYDENGMK